ncbi:MAG: TolC family protein, partial [Burkholderiaceae bacterium]|nr:TolC family protein [Burkholderiaceae bacterium]
MTLPALRCALVALAAIGLGGCATPPPYRKPVLDMPAAWQTEAPWRASAPSDGAAKGEWWLRFQDPQLNALMRQALGGNQTLAVAQARLTQARTLVASSEAATFPQVNLGARVARLKISANRPLTNYNASNFSTVQDDYATTLSVSYEADLAGRVQSTVDGARASAEQSAADLENLRLLVGADLASNYFSLRALDTELNVLSRSIALQRRALELATARHDLGASSGLDVAQQQALLDNTLTQVDLLRRQRGQ